MWLSVSTIIPVCRLLKWRRGERNGISYCWTLLAAKSEIDRDTGVLSQLFQYLSNCTNNAEISTKENNKEIEFSVFFLWALLTNSVWETKKRFVTKNPQVSHLQKSCLPLIMRQQIYWTINFLLLSEDEVSLIFFLSSAGQWFVFPW